MRLLMLVTVLGVATLFNTATAQNLITKSSKVTFFSDGLLEDITAINPDAKGVLNYGSGEFLFKIPITSFEFENDLMQEHFNENYMESEKYPYGTFKGKLTPEDLKKVGKNEVTLLVNGQLNIHGVIQDRKVPVTISGDSNQLSVKSVFNVSLADHEIEIPTIVFQKIAETVEVTVDAQMEALSTKPSKSK